MPEKPDNPTRANGTANEGTRASGPADPKSSKPGAEPPASKPVPEPDNDAQPVHAAQDETAETAQARIEKLEEQIADLTKRLLSSHAEIQNLHKRHERERTDASKYAITKFARDTVAVADNFERAIASVPEGATADNPVLEALLDGVTMTEREFLNVLERHGVKRVTPSGEIFNPHQHQAMMERNDPSVTAGTILEVYQPGYVIGDRVLRPAMVVVAKGGPKPAKSEKPDGDAPGEVEDAANGENLNTGSPDNDGAEN